jgi:cytochrome c-type biogenesis protein CcmH/NrfF
MVLTTSTFIWWTIGVAFLFLGVGFMFGILMRRIGKN